MNHPSPAPAASVTPALFVGIDWADKKHDVHWIHADGRHGSRIVEQSAEAIQQLVGELTTLANGGLVVLALESSRGPLQTALACRTELTLYPIDPKQFARYRESFTSGGGKSDPGDAALLARMLCERYRQLTPFQPDDEKTRRIGLLAQTRRELVDQGTRLELQLQAALKTYFPQLLELGPVDSPLVLYVLEHWPDPREFRRLHPATLTKLFRRHGWKNQERIKTQIEQLRKSPLLTTDPPIIESLAFRASALAGQRIAIAKRIPTIELAIQQAMADHPDAKLFQAIPGAGKALAPRLLAAFGSIRERYANADQVASVSGIAPITKQSGKTKLVVRRRACPRFLKQTFHEFAEQAARWCPWSKAYYQHLRSKSMRYHAAIRKLASRWIRILFRVWKTRIPYDPQRYLQRMIITKHPLIQYLTSHPATT